MASTFASKSDYAYLFTVLVSDDGPLGGTRIRTQYNAIFVQAAYNGSTGAGCLGKLHALGRKVVVPNASRSD